NLERGEPELGFSVVGDRDRIEEETNDEDNGDPYANVHGLCPVFDYERRGSNFSTNNCDGLLGACRGIRIRSGGELTHSICVPIVHSSWRQTSARIPAFNSELHIPA